jgi:predicted  nucleic acid-binding Zn-ribbon protein
MAIDIMSLLRQTRSERAGDIEALATRLVDGQQVPADEVLQTMTGLGISDKDLQAECDRIERVRELRQRAKAGPVASKHLAKLDAELGKLTEAHNRAGQTLLDWHHKHDEQHMTLRHQVEAADRAANELLVTRNLPGRDRDAIATAERQAADTSAAAAEKQRRVDDLRSQVRASESLLAGQQKTDKRMLDAETRRQIDHLTQTIDKTKAKLADAQAELLPARKAAGEAEATLRDLVDSIRRRVTA